MRPGLQPGEMRFMGCSAHIAFTPHQTVGLGVTKAQASTSSLVSSRSDRSGGLRHSLHGPHHREVGGHMKINLPVFKDKDTKDTVSYQSWHWGLMMYHQAGC